MEMGSPWEGPSVELLYLVGWGGGGTNFEGPVVAGSVCLVAKDRDTYSNRAATYSNRPVMLRNCK